MTKHSHEHSTSEKLASGLVGAMALTGIHETVRRMSPNAPRMDRYAKRVVARGMESAGIMPPSAGKMEAITLVGDLVSNAIFYGMLAGRDKEHSLLRGAAIGAIAGGGAVVLPPLIGLGSRPSNATGFTRCMTVLFYTLGGIATAAAFKAMDRSR